MRLASPFVWTAVVLFLGSMYFANERTGAFLLPLLRTAAPLIGADVQELHNVLRKAAHAAEYAVLAALWFHAFAWRRRAITASWIALCICLACAVADEAHQSLLPNRTASARDVLIDAAGAVVALSIVRRRRERLAELGIPLAARLPYVRVA